MLFHIIYVITSWCDGEQVGNIRRTKKRPLTALKLISDMTREDHKLNHLLLPKRSEVTERNTRANKNCFYNFFSRTNRFRNSPILHATDVFNKTMNRALNNCS